MFSERQKKQKGSLLQRRARYGYLFILPLISGVIFLFIPNIMQTFRYSVSDIQAGDGFRLTYTGFRYYYDAFRTDPNFVPLLLSDVQRVLTQTPVVLIYSLFIATILNQRFRGRIIARLIFFVPVILAAGVLTTADSWTMEYALSGIGVDRASNPLSNLTDIRALLTSVNLPPALISVVSDAVSNIYTITRVSGMQIFIFLAGLQEISGDLYEAASIEGCSKWELFWKITFPMILPQIAVNLVYTLADAGSGKNPLLTYTNNVAFNQNSYSLATAMNIVFLVCLALIVCIFLAVIRKLTPDTK